MSTVFSRFMTTAALAAVVFASHQLHAASFEAAFRSPQAAYFVTGIGEVHSFQPGQPLRKAFMFSQNGKPFRWTKTPSGLTQWKSEWFVADGSQRLARFDASGSFKAFVTIPAPATVIVSAGDALWFVNPVASSAANQLWRSTDGKTFKALQPAGTASEPFETITRNLLIVAGSASGELYTSAIIGPPVVERVFPAQKRATIRTAYSRSKGRAGMEEVHGVIDDVTKFSLPVRDLYSLPHGELVALRNREDVMGDNGRVQEMLGRRADRYDASGRHVSTATFERPVHFIVSVTPTLVTAVSREGLVVTAKWSKAVPGAIVTL